MLDRLEIAHTATIEWLEARLAEVGRTGTSALEATPVQTVVAAGRRVLAAPFGVVSSAVNRGSVLLGRKASSLEDLAAEAGERVADTAQKAVSSTTQTVSQAAGKAAETATDVIDLTGVDAQHPPLTAYDKLSGDTVMRHVADTEDLDEVRRILAFEQAHKDRKGVVQAARARLQELSTTS